MSEDQPSLVEQFVAVLEATGGQAHVVAHVGDVADHLARVAGEQNTRRILYAPSELSEQVGLSHHLAARGLDLVELDEVGKEAKEITVGLTGATLAVAESGSLLLGGRPGPEGLVSVLPWVHLVLIRATDIVSDISTAFEHVVARLEDGEGDWVWVTGPSRTADIAHTLVLGAHGPNALHVMILGADR
jgi:L-lactate dehydrogenase complex protein LldG